MFEKEAEEYEKRKHYRYEDNEYCSDIADGIIQAYQKGAEFAYNKANEWHYVKDGDLPRQYEHTCFSIDVLADNKKWVYYEFGSGKWFCGNKEVNVIAWKEIVFPKKG